MIGIETHTEGKSFSILEERGISLTKKLLLLAFDTPDENYPYLNDPDFKMTETYGGGYFPEEYIDWIRGDTDYILSGGMYDLCLKHTFEEMVENGISGNYHFVRGLVRAWGKWGIFDEKVGNKYIRTARDAGFNVQVFYNGRSQLFLLRKPQVNLYYWSSLDKFAKHIT